MNNSTRSKPGIQGMSEALGEGQSQEPMLRRAEEPAAPADLSPPPPDMSQADLSAPAPGPTPPLPKEDPLKGRRIGPNDLGREVNEIIQETILGETAPLSPEDVSFLDSYVIDNCAYQKEKVGTRLEVTFRTCSAEGQIQADRILAGEEVLTTKMGYGRILNIVNLATNLYNYNGQPTFSLPPRPAKPYTEREIDDAFATPEAVNARINFVRRLDMHIVDHLLDKLEAFRTRLDRLLSSEVLENF